MRDILRDVCLGLRWRSMVAKRKDGMISETSGSAPEISKSALIYSLSLTPRGIIRHMGYPGFRVGELWIVHYFFLSVLDCERRLLVDHPLFEPRQVRQATNGLDYGRGDQLLALVEVRRRTDYTADGARR